MTSESDTIRSVSITIETSDWQCHLLGISGGVVFTPRKDCEPNFFHRLMQRLAFGIVWTKKEP